MKLSFSFLLILMAAQVLAFDGSKCQPGDYLFRQLQGLDQFLWNPNFQENCDPSKVSIECQSYKKELEAKHENWRAYLNTCQVETATLSRAFSCTNFIRDGVVSVGTLWFHMIEMNMAEMERTFSDQECSKQPELKEKIISQYNQENPQLLQFNNKAAQENLRGRTCAQITSFLTSYNRETRAKVNSVYAEPLPANKILSAEGIEFVLWRRSLLRKFQPEQPFYKIIEAIMARRMRNFSCMSVYRQTEAICDLTRQLLLSGRTVVRHFAEDISVPGANTGAWDSVGKVNGGPKAFDLPGEAEAAKSGAAVARPALSAERQALLKKIEGDYKLFLAEERKELVGNIGKKIRFPVDSSGGIRELVGELRGLAGDKMVVRLETVPGKFKLIQLPIDSQYIF